MEAKQSIKAVYNWEAIGAFFIIAFGSLLHYFYAWSGDAAFVGLFAPVNESVWEHLKLGFWPLILFSAVEYPFVRKQAANFFLAKFPGVLALETFIVIVFYSYTSITGRPILPIDIGSFVLGTGLCQFIALRVYSKTKPALPAAIAGGTGLALIALCFMVFTFAAPHLGIFRDSHGGIYGPVKSDLGK